MICDKEGVGIGQGAGVLCSFVWTQNSLFRTDPELPIGGNGPQGSISVPQVPIGGLFDSSIKTITNRLWFWPEAVIYPSKTRNVTKNLGISLNNLETTTEENNETHQNISKKLRAKLLKLLKPLKLNNLPPKTLRTFLCYKKNCPGIKNPLYRKTTWHVPLEFLVQTLYGLRFMSHHHKNKTHHQWEVHNIQYFYNDLHPLHL